MFFMLRLCMWVISLTVYHVSCISVQFWEVSVLWHLLKYLIPHLGLQQTTQKWLILMLIPLYEALDFRYFLSADFPFYYLMTPQHKHCGVMITIHVNLFCIPQMSEKPLNPYPTSFTIWASKKPLKHTPDCGQNLFVNHKIVECLLHFWLQYNFF